MLSLCRLVLGRKAALKLRMRVNALSAGVMSLVLDASGELLASMLPLSDKPGDTTTIAASPPRPSRAYAPLLRSTRADPLQAKPLACTLPSLNHP